jgi:hypothetical protein
VVPEGQLKDQPDAQPDQPDKRPGTIAIGMRSLVRGRRLLTHDVPLLLCVPCDVHCVLCALCARTPTSTQGVS